MAAQKNRMAAAVFAILTGVVMVLLNLPYAYKELHGEWSNHATLDFGWSGQVGERMPTEAGFPFTYYTATQSPTDISVAVWSAPILALDIALGAALVALVFGLTCLRYRWGLLKQSRWRKPVLLDAMWLLLAGIVITGTTWKLHEKTAAHRRLAAEASQYGTCYLGCWVPAIIEPRLPHYWAHFFSRIRTAKLSHPPEDLLSRLTQLDSLTSLQVYGGQIQTPHLAMLRSNRLFHVLHLNRMSLDAQQMACIGELTGLEEISLAETNVDGPLLRKLDALPDLKVVHLLRTPLLLKDLGLPAWKETVQKLYLPRGSKRHGERLTLDRWNNLRSLVVSDPATDLSPHAIRLELFNLPRLRVLLVNRVQKYELIAKNLPRLALLTDDYDLLSLIGSSLDRVPSQPWISRLELDNVPSLERIDCYAQDLKEVVISGTPSLRELNIVSGTLADVVNRSQPSIPIPHMQAIVNSIGDCTGPPWVSFESVDFAGIDLTPLKQNSAIRELAFHISDLDFDQIRQLEGLDRLQTLHAERCEATADQLDWLLQKFKRLESLDLNISGVDEFTLTNHPSLNLFRTRPLQQVRRVCLKHVPRLDTQLHISCPVNEICIDGAPRLSGLGLASPWPVGGTISGLRDLRWFAAGGPHVNDSVLSALLYCGSLDRLMLAYPSITKEGLYSIGGFHELTSLVLPGAPVDDEVTSHYRQLKLLREVNFDDSQVAGETLEWLLGIESLRRLAINRVVMPDEDLSKLMRFSQLNDLEVAGVPLPDDVFHSLLVERTLEHLNYADHALSEKQFACLLRNRSLRLLNLSNCGISVEEAKQLLQANERLVLYLGDDEVSRRLVTKPTPRHQPRVIGSQLYQKLSLSLANYSVPHDSLLRTDYTPSDGAALFGWFAPCAFRD